MDPSAAFGSVYHLISERQNELADLRDRGWDFDIIVRWKRTTWSGPSFRAEELALLGRLGLNLWITS
jgi:hypothetical protein